MQVLNLHRAGVRSINHQLGNSMINQCGKYIIQLKDAIRANQAVQQEDGINNLIAWGAELSESALHALTLEMFTWAVQARANNILDKKYALGKDFGGEAYNTPGANLFFNIRYQPE